MAILALALVTYRTHSQDELPQLPQALRVGLVRYVRGTNGTTTAESTEWNEGQILSNGFESRGHLPPVPSSQHATSETSSSQQEPETS